ncbi:hypothetical protein [Streptomyces sp. NPDC006971]
MAKQGEACSSVYLAKRESADWFQLTANPAESEALSRMLDTCDI